MSVLLQVLQLLRQHAAKRTQRAARPAAMLAACPAYPESEPPQAAADIWLI